MDSVCVCVPHNSDWLWKKVTANDRKRKKTRKTASEMDKKEKPIKSNADMQEAKEDDFDCQKHTVVDIQLVNFLSKSRQACHKNGTTG